MRNLDKINGTNKPEYKKAIYRNLLINSRISEVVHMNVEQFRDMVAVLVSEGKISAEFDENDRRLLEDYFQAILFQIGKEFVVPRVFHEFNNLLNVISMEIKYLDSNHELLDQARERVDTIIEKFRSAEEIDNNEFIIYADDIVMVGLPNDDDKTKELPDLTPELIQDRFISLVSEKDFSKEEIEQIKIIVQKIKKRMEDFEEVIETIMRQKISGVEIVNSSIHNTLKIINELLETLFIEDEDIVTWAKHVSSLYKETVKKIKELK